MIVIVNYGLGNTGSILNMLKKIGEDVIIASDAATIAKAEKLILSGVGAFDSGMRGLMELGIIELLSKKVIEQKTPVLGICLGMQLFAKKSSEGCLPGLGWLNAEAVKFRLSDNDGALKVPHMGWNGIRQKKQSYLLDDMYDNTRFYFVHSYHLACNDRDDILATTQYGVQFVSAVQKDNIVGVQFHPEKSHKYGLKLLANFARGDQNVRA